MMMMIMIDDDDDNILTMMMMMMMMMMKVYRLYVIKVFLMLINSDTIRRTSTPLI